MEIYYVWTTVKNAHFGSNFEHVEPFGFYLDLQKAIEDVKDFPVEEELCMSEVFEDYELQKGLFRFKRVVLGTNDRGHEITVEFVVNMHPYESDKPVF